MKIIFTELNLKSELNLAMSKLGYVSPTPIQKLTIPASLENKDIFGKSHTGTGKTAAFLLPILHNLNLDLKRNQALIMCPTRELAIQVAQQVKKYSEFLKGVHTALLCGGMNMGQQLRDLKYSNIVIGTPGRVADHLDRNSLKLRFLKTIVLDEADEMLKMGFKKEIDFVFENTPENVQTILFSATTSRLVQEIANNYQTNPVHINIDNELEKEQQKNIKQYYIDTNNKEMALVELFTKLEPKLSIIFSNTKMYTDKLQNLLRQNNINSVVINGDKSQRERQYAMNDFKSGRANILIATDVVARGIHVEGIDYVFNYDIPKEAEYYTHRIGRTARAGKTGTAITLVGNKNQQREIQNLEKYQGQAILPFPIKLENNTPFVSVKRERNDRFNRNSRNNNNRRRYF